MIVTKVDTHKRDEGVLVVTNATVPRDVLLKILVDNGFVAEEGASWNISDDQKVITIKSSKLVPQSVVAEAEEDDEDLESDC